MGATTNITFDFEDFASDFSETIDLMVQFLRVPDDGRDSFNGNYEPNRAVSRSSWSKW